MGFINTIDWDRIKTDLQKGLDKGAVAVRKGAIVAQKKAGELTEEGKRQYRIMVLKSKVHTAVSDLGARVYALMSSRGKNLSTDARVKDMVVQIKKMDAQIAALEGKGQASARKVKTKR